jgi:hypothetical protein
MELAALTLDVVALQRRQVKRMVLYMNCQFVKRLENHECRRSIAEVWYAPKEAVS